MSNYQIRAVLDLLVTREMKLRAQVDKKYERKTSQKQYLHFLNFRRKEMRKQRGNYPSPLFVTESI